MEKGLNFRTLESRLRYHEVYEQSLALCNVALKECYVETSFGKTHVLCCGNQDAKPLVLVHAASCGSPIWYPNLPAWSEVFCVYAIDLITESSKSILTKKISTPQQHATWVKETLDGLKLSQVCLCGLSIGGWTVANFASFFPARVHKVVLLSPIQTFAKMHLSFFAKIMKMGFRPTRENVEHYIGWGSEKEAPLPSSIIEQFTISVMNMNANASFPKWIKKDRLQQITMPTLVVFGEHEFAFSVDKAKKRARQTLQNVQIEVIKDASHLVSASQPERLNQVVLAFLENETTHCI